MFIVHSSKFATKPILIALLLFSACTNYKQSTSSFLNETGSNQSTLDHPLYHVIPRHRSQIKPYDIGHWTTWMLFGNDDHGIFGEDHDPIFCHQEPDNIGKAFKWFYRNPLHNFCWYVIGSGHKVNSEFAIIKCNPRQMHVLTYRSSPDFGLKYEPSFFLGFYGWKPFVSLHLFYNKYYRGQFYIGWRNRGNFGIKFLPIIKRKPEDYSSPDEGGCSILRDERLNYGTKSKTL